MNDLQRRAHEHQVRRINAVFGSEYSQGLESQAAKLLSNPKLEAREIIGLLADMKTDHSPAATAAMWARVQAANRSGGRA